MENKNIIIILLVVIVALLVSLVALMSEMNKQDSDLKIADKNINAGDALVVKLTDINGNPISNQIVNIKLTDKNRQTVEKGVRTDSDGNAKMKVDNEGTYAAKCTFDGTDKYSSSSVDANISVEKAKTKLIDEKKTSPSKSNSQSSGGSSDYPKYNSALGNYKIVETQQELVLIETINGQNYVLAGDGYYTYGGHDSQGKIKLGSYVGKY